MVFRQALPRDQQTRGGAPRGVGVAEWGNADRLIRLDRNSCTKRLRAPREQTRKGHGSRRFHEPPGKQHSASNWSGPRFVQRGHYFIDIENLVDILFSRNMVQALDTARRFHPEDDLVLLFAPGVVKPALRWGFRCSSLARNNSGE